MANVTKTDMTKPCLQQPALITSVLVIFIPEKHLKPEQKGYLEQNIHSSNTYTVPKWCKRKPLPCYLGIAGLSPSDLCQGAQYGKIVLCSQGGSDGILSVAHHYRNTCQCACNNT